MSNTPSASKKNRASVASSNPDATRRPIEAGKVFHLKDLQENGWNLLPYLKRHKWENFVQIKELVYPNLVKEFYEIAYSVDSLRSLGHSHYRTPSIWRRVDDPVKNSQRACNEKNVDGRNPEH